MNTRWFMWLLVLISSISVPVLVMGASSERANSFPKLGQKYWVTTVDGMTNWTVTFVQHEADNWYRVTDGTGEYFLNLSGTVKLREIQPPMAEAPNG